MTRTTLILLLVVGVATPGQAEEPGVVLLIDGVEAEGAGDAASDAGGAEWRVESLARGRATPTSAPLDAIAAIEALYDEGDFPRCLTALTAPELDETELLARGHVDAAARLLVVSAACTIAAGDLDRGTESFRRAFVLELEVDSLLADLRPDIAELAEAARTAVHASGRVALTIDTLSGAQVLVDGRDGRCGRAPCVVRLVPGAHVVSISALGRARRVLRLDVQRDTRIAPRLDSPDPEQARQSLGEALGEGTNPEGHAFVRAAADVYGARVMLVVRSARDRVRAAIYDRGLNRIVARQSSEASTRAARLLVGSVIDEWRGEVEGGTPWWVWTIVGASVLVAGVAAFVLLRPVLSDYSFRFGD